jgi:acyl-homoserine-lactone acylase
MKHFCFQKNISTRLIQMYINNHRKLRLSAIIGVILATIGVSACSSDDDEPVTPPEAISPPPPDFSAKIQRTEFGIPHITADNYKGLGYGLGYAFASDNICSLAA